MLKWQKNTVLSPSGYFLLFLFLFKQMVAIVLVAPGGECTEKQSEVCAFCPRKRMHRKTIRSLLPFGFSVLEA